MIFKQYNCDFGIKIDGVKYEFSHVMNFQIENPENTKLVRGANGSNLLGIVYKEGLKEPKKVTVTVMDMSSEMRTALEVCYAEQKRVDVWAVDRTDGSSKIAKNAILSQQPMQLGVDETAESLNVSLVFESYDLSEIHKT